MGFEEAQREDWDGKEGKEVGERHFCPGNELPG